MVLLFYSSTKKGDRQVIDGSSLVISAPFYHGFAQLVAAQENAGGKGMQWDRKGKTSDTKSDIFHAPGGKPGSFYSMGRVYEMMAYCCLLYIGLTWYFDHIIPNAYGLASHPLFFLDPAYWGCAPAKKTDPPVGDVEEDPNADADVKAEAAFVEEGSFKGRSEIAVVIKGLQKTVLPPLE